MFRALDNPQEIRVLHLNAGQRSDPPTGQLEHVTLAHPPQFEAISYEWGDPTKTRSITLEDGSAFPITESLHHALRDIRHDAAGGESRTLWADAICIDQQNITELQHQVSIMGQIYRNAAQVITYIGPERDDSTLAISFARTLQDYVRMTGDNLPFFSGRYALPPLSDGRWAALKALVLRTWASRCWCAHEFILNRQLLVMCGPVEIPDWHLIPDIVQHVVNRSLPVPVLPSGEEDPQCLRECLISLYRLREIVLRYPNHRFTLLEILDRSHPFKATDVRDKIYSVLGLAEDAKDLAVTIDYNCSAEQLYVGTAAKIVKHDPRGMEILYNCLHVKSLSPPSWVPDWSHWEFGSHGASLGIGYDASGSSVSEVEVDGTRLRVAGSLIDEIEYVGEYIGPQFAFLGQGSSERKAWLESEYTDLMRPFRGQGHTAEAATALFWRTLIGNITGDEIPANQSYMVYYEALLRYNGQESSAETTAMAGDFCDAVRRRSRYRRLARSRMGYIGAIPMTASAGDWICMFQGSPLLFVVRPKGPDFSFLGHAYVHGLMNGEVLQAEWYQKQTITLV